MMSYQDRRKTEHVLSPEFLRALKQFSWLVFFLLLSIPACAELIILRSGRQIEGKILDRTDASIVLDVGIDVDITYYLDEVAQIGDEKIATRGEREHIMEFSGWLKQDIEKFLKEEYEFTEFESVDTLWRHLRNADEQDDQTKLKQYTDLLSAVQASHPDSLLARFGLAYLLLKKGEHQQAEEHLSAIRQKRPDFTYLDQLTVDLYLETGRTPEALALYETIALKPSKSTLEDTSLYLKFSRAYQNNGEFAKAVAAARQSLALKQDPQAHYALARALNADGQYKEAIDAYKSAVTLEPHFYDAWQELAQSYLRFDDYQKAAEVYQQLMSFDISKVKNLYEYAYCQLKLRKYEQAISNFRAVLVMEPENKAAAAHLQTARRKALRYYDLKGKELFLAKNAEAARAAFHHAQEFGDELADPFYFLAVISFNEDKDYPQSFELVSKAIALDGSRAIFFYQRGLTEQKLNKMGEAMDSFEECLRLDPQIRHAREIKAKFPSLK